MSSSLYSLTDTAHSGNPHQERISCRGILGHVTTIVWIINTDIAEESNSEAATVMCSGVQLYDELSERARAELIDGSFIYGRRTQVFTPGSAGEAGPGIGRYSARYQPASAVVSLSLIHISEPTRPEPI
eukprot:1925014-Pyramimonas_sp.AAC.1